MSFNPDEKYFVIQGMKEYGGSFVKALGEALAHADIDNANKIENTWRDYWKKYLEIGYNMELAGDLNE